MLVQDTLGDVAKIVQQAMDNHERDLKQEVLDNIAVTLSDLAVELGTTHTTLTKVKRLGFLDDCIINVGASGVLYDIAKAREGFVRYNNSKILNRMYA